MKYQNANDILPKDLVRKLQEYIDGEYLYIPSQQSRKAWGEKSGVKSALLERNMEIAAKYRQGCPLAELATDYFLSIHSIRRIVYQKAIKKGI